MIDYVLSQPGSLPTTDVDRIEVLTVIDTRGVIRFITPAAAQFYGYEPGQMMGHSALRFIRLDQRARVARRWQAIVADPDWTSESWQVTLVKANQQQVEINAAMWRLPEMDAFLLVHQVTEGIRDRLDTLYAIQNAVARSLDLDDILDTVLREVHRLIPCGTSTIFIYDPDSTVRVRRWQEGRIEHYRSPIHEHLPEFETSRLLRENNAPLIINDTETSSLWVSLPNHRPIRSWLGAPLNHSGLFLGELNLDSPSPNQFTEEDAELVHALAIQVAAALHKARQLEEEQRRAARFRALNDVNQAISQLDLRSVLEVVYQKINRLMDTSTFFIALHDPEAHQVQLVGSYDHGVKRADEVQADDVGITGLVLRTRKSLIIHDSQIDELPPEVIVQDEMPHSLLMMPLIALDEIVGVITVQSYVPYAYTKEDIDMLETIAGAVATAVRNAQLYDQTVYRLHALETLHSLSLDLAAVQDPEQIAHLVARAALGLFVPRTVALCLCEGLPWIRESWIATLDPLSHQAQIDTLPGPINNAMFERVRMTDEAVVFPDLNLEPDLQADMDMPWLVQAAAVTPVRRGDTRFAVLGMLYDEPQVFRSDMRRILDLMSLQSASAFENARNTISLHRRLTEACALQDLARRVSEMQSLDEILNTVVDTIRNVYQCKSASIALLDETLGEVITMVGAGLSPEHVASARFKLGEYVAGVVVSENRVIYVPDTLSDPNFRVVDPEIRSIMVVPLTVQGRAIGSLGIDSSAVDAFSKDHERVLTIAGGQIAAAIETVRLLQETRKRAEELAGANLQLQAQDSLRKELTYQVTHDLRSPLQIIYGYTDMMHNAELGPVTEMQKDVLDLILKRSKTIERMTKDIMGAKPINRESLEFETVDLTQLCQQAITDIQLVFRDDRFIFETELAPVSLKVRADYHRLSRVLDNLINNAIKFSPDGGTITLRTAHDATGGRALVSVSDQGIGIAPDKIDYVFERFYRADRKRFDGSGLGLYIVQQIVHAHDGKVWVESEESKGSTFTVALPLIER